MRIAKGLIITAITITATISCSIDPIKIVDGNCCQKEYKDEIVEIYGALYLPNKIMDGNWSMIGIRTKSDEKAPALSIKVGNGPNSMARLMDGYTEDDVHVYGNNGEEIQLGDSIRVVGEMVFAASYYCELKVSTIEKVK